ncbi:MAG: hypothetical protein K8T91_05505 [Planctomycetes bacterium]|nr:hypothetical protein [Planctomycetota bacterium]
MTNRNDGSQLRRRPRRSAMILVLAATLAGVSWHHAAQPLMACEIPVFRYALERWSPDPYQIMVVHRSPLTKEQQTLIRRIEVAADQPAKPANLQVLTVDLAAKTDDPTLKLLQAKYETLTAPLITVCQPHSQPDATPIWTAPLTAENIDRLVDSPARQELVRRLTTGHSAVWIMLDTGNAEQDNAAVAVIEKELARLSKELKLPEKSVLEADEFFKPETKVELKIDFSLLRLKPGDANEEAFRAMLLASEADLKDLKEPIVMPVFGRGRACFALVGKGISSQQMEENSRFLVGRCSCQIKHDNPGVDLLLAANWDNLVGGRSDVSKPLPELSGLGVLVVDVEPAGDTKPAGAAPPLPQKLGLKTVTPVALSPASTTAATEPTAAADKPKELADSRPAPMAAGPSVADTNNPPTLFLAPIVAIVIGVGILLAVVGSLWLRNRGGAGS